MKVPIARMIPSLTLLALSGCGGDPGISDPCSGVEMMPLLEDVNERYAIKRSVYARIKNTNLEPRLVTVALRSGHGRTQREGPFRIESKDQQDFLIGAVGLQAGRSIAELEQRGFAFTVDRCE
jgi:hypothetical protein